MLPSRGGEGNSGLWLELLPGWTERTLGLDNDLIQERCVTASNISLLEVDTGLALCHHFLIARPLGETEVEVGGERRQ